jgi:hypothetical protein
MGVLWVQVCGDGRGKKAREVPVCRVSPIRIKIARHKWGRVRCVKVCDEAIRPVQAIIRFSIVTVLGRMTRSCTCTRRLSAGLEFMIAEFNFRPLALFSPAALIETKYLPGPGPIPFGLTIAEVRPQTPKDCPSLSPPSPVERATFHRITVPRTPGFTLWRQSLHRRSAGHIECFSNWNLPHSITTNSFNRSSNSGA